jgi:glycosyltransferase involved in cell wall biosynthesis
MLGALNDPRTLLWALDLFAMPSLNEGLGIAALEAMACGIPVIASAIGGLPEAVIDGVTGRLVKRGDAPALAGAIIALARESEMRAAMGAAGRARALDHFSMQVMARGTLDVYCETLAGR